MKLKSKVLLIGSLIALKVVFTACDIDDETDYDSPYSSIGSTASSYTLKPPVHDTSYSSICNIQTASQYQAADIRYAQYEECMQIHDGDPACEGYYSNYMIQVKHATQVLGEVGC